MDVSTALVQAYLHLNGYFTATDYPVVEREGVHAARMLTDIDMLAVRFDRGQRDPGSHVAGPMVDQPDPVLRCPRDATDMIVAEIKQGRAEVNRAARLRRVLGASLARFGCCEPAETEVVVDGLLRRGSARTRHGHTVRMLLFASRGERAPRGWHWVHLDHVVRYVDDYLRDTKERLGGADLHDPALAWLALLDKCGLRISPRDPQR